MRYKVGDRFRFRGESAARCYNNNIIVEIKEIVGLGPQVWFDCGNKTYGRQWIGADTFDDPTSDYYGIITSSHKEFTDEEYESLLV